MRVPYDSISFAGCGALNFYQVGVAQALREIQPFHHTQLLGASAGAALAVLLSDGYEPFTIVSRMLQLTANIAGPRRLLGPGGIQAISDAFTDEFITDTTHQMVSGRVHLSITRVPGLRNIRVNYFTSRNDLADAIRASSFVPSLRRPSRTFRGLRCIDGGASDNEPILSPNTLRVSPLWTSIRAHIRPTPMHIGLNEIFRLPTPRRAWELFDHGLRAGREHLARTADLSAPAPA